MNIENKTIAVVIKENVNTTTVGDPPSIVADYKGGSLVIENEYDNEPDTGSDSLPDFYSLFLKFYN